MMKRIFFAVSSIAWVFIFESGARALDTTPVLSLELAKNLIAGCEAKAREKGWKMNVSVVDGGANLILFERMDGAFLGGADLSRSKAETSAKFPASTRQFEQLVYGKDLKGGQMPGMALVPGLVAFAGGLSIITANGIHIGAIGVSGGLADEDESCAQAGLDLVKDMLK